MAPRVSTIDILVLVLSLVAFLVVRGYRRRSGLPYPPGPRPLPLIGNLFDIPKEFSWLEYTQLSKKYGDVLCLHVFGKVIIILNSVKATKDLLEKRGDIYSDRPAIPMYEMMRWEWLVPFARYTEFWRQARKLLDRGLRPGAVSAYRPVQQAKARVLLTQLLADPDDWESHLEYLSGEQILAMVYGYEVQGRNDHKVNAAKEMAQLVSESALPGVLLVNDIPLLRYIPEWFPWLSYKPLARYGHNLGNKVMYGPMTYVKESILNGSARPSLALENLQETEKLEGSERKNAEETIAGALGSMYAAGTDTTLASMVTFFVAVLLRPDVQAMVQKELDAATGRERLPTFEDRPRLPMVDAVCREVLRWRPVTPLAIAHAATEDNIYEGYFIPKGAMVIGNSWAILHDPAMYPEPDAFKPERFINADGSLRDDPALTSAFGFGRRVCPGRHFVDASFFIVVASILSVFNIEKDKGSGGGPDAYPFTGNGITRPARFPCIVVPRDKRAEELIVAETLAR